MAKRMLVDATHPEETRVVVVHGNRLEEFDFETASRKQLKGNIYLAKVTRVEPSLQAAFVEYGGNRHGFLAFSEIHPDYFRIPVDDRQQLLAAEESESAQQTDLGTEAESAGSDNPDGEILRDPRDDDDGAFLTARELSDSDDEDDPEPASSANGGFGGDVSAGERSDTPENGDDSAPNGGTVETVGGDDVDEARERRLARIRRSYKIQEVIKRRQILLIQVTKEERGNKGAALTTFLSLAGRYCVLMPNTPRGGGISRKIANPKDRKRMKAILDELDLPEGMAVILRTAGLERTKTEIRRDLDYLLRLWDSIRETTLKSSAPTLIHEEANLIKRAIRDLYSKDIDEIDVAGDEGYRTAKDFMRMLVPSHARKVRPYRDDAIPLFQRYQIETQIDAMHSPTVQLKSGGYIVINPTEALVAIDVNSGRSTRERNIEETAYRTNMEAAEEVARQLRLRDMAGLIVIDFIDMEQDRHNNGVERKLKDALRFDRARIQVGRISHFGLLEMSRQRLRPSLVETHFDTCKRCDGTGLVRSIGSAALHILRTIEEEGIRQRADEISVAVPTEIALYLLNEKRDALVDVEQRYGFRVLMRGDDTLIGTEHRLLTTRARGEAEQIARPAIDATRISFDVAEDEEDTPIVQSADGDSAENPADGGEEQPQRKRRSRRGRRRREDAPKAVDDQVQVADDSPVDGSDVEAAKSDAAKSDGTELTAETDKGETAAEGEQRKRRRRGRRGGRRRTGSDEVAADGTTGTDGAAPQQGVETGANAVEPALLSNEEQPADGRTAGDQTGSDQTGDVQSGDVPLGGDLAVVETEATQELPEPAQLDAEPAPAIEEPKPKRKRASRSRASTKKTAADASETKVADDLVSTESADGEADAKPVAEKPKRAPRRKPAAKKATKATKAAPKSASETPPEPPVDVPTPAPEPVLEPVGLATANATSEPHQGTGGTSENAETAVKEAENQTSGPPRRGWWRRVLDG